MSLTGDGRRHEVTAGTGERVEAMSRSLARAFHDDPVMAWLFPDEAGRPERLGGFFALLLRDVHLPHGGVWTAGADAAVAVWDPPGHWRVSLMRQARSGAAFLRLLGGRTLAGMRALAATEARHPRWPHWYLAVLGTDPEHQGRGLGAAVVDTVLERCDAAGVGAYLESSKPGNIPYYERFGFRVVEELRLPGGPPVWPMWRHPRPGA